MAATLCEVSCPRLELIKLSVNKAIFSLEALDEPIELGALAAVRTLVLAACTSLRRLPASIGKLSRLHTLVLTDCQALEEWPASMVELTSLRFLDLRG